MKQINLVNRTTLIRALLCLLTAEVAWKKLVRDNIHISEALRNSMTFRASSSGITVWNVRGRTTSPTDR